VLYRCAKQDKDRRFYALYDKVARSDVLWKAWGEVRGNRGAPGVDGVSIGDVVDSGVSEFLEELAARLGSGTYRSKALRRVHIPKPGRPGQVRPLGIPCIADRVVMAAAKIVLEPIFEADFLPTSYGFRPGLSAHHALETIRQTVSWRGKQWALDADIRSCLEPSSHCLRVHGGGVEQAGFGVWDQYSQAFSASVADVEGLQLAALDTLQHGLAGDAEDGACQAG
jgi:retron-type reverse transcriptase